MTFAEDITLNAGLFSALFSFLLLIALGLFGWVLSNAVKLGNIATRLDSRMDDHERRITELEKSQPTKEP